VGEYTAYVEVTLLNATEAAIATVPGSVTFERTSLPPVIEFTRKGSLWLVPANNSLVVDGARTLAAGRPARTGWLTVIAIVCWRCPAILSVAVQEPEPTAVQRDGRAGGLRLDVRAAAAGCDVLDAVQRL